MINEEYKYSELTGKIIGCAMKVHRELGSEFQEVIYQRALAIELTELEIPFIRELHMPVMYRDRQIGTRRVDFMVADHISVELKAVTELNGVHLNQALNYLEVYRVEIGLLINFGENSLKVKRVRNKKWEAGLP